MKKAAWLVILVAVFALEAIAGGAPPAPGGAPAGGAPAAPDAPEIDPSSIAAASALVFSGLVILRGRRKF